jgi:hypothetical protein
MSCGRWNDTGEGAEDLVATMRRRTLGRLTMRERQQSQLQVGLTRKRFAPPGSFFVLSINDGCSSFSDHSIYHVRSESASRMASVRILYPSTWRYPSSPRAKHKVNRPDRCHLASSGPFIVPPCGWHFHYSPWLRLQAMCELAQCVRHVSGVS